MAYDPDKSVSDKNYKKTFATRKELEAMEEEAAAAGEEPDKSQAENQDESKADESGEDGGKKSAIRPKEADIKAKEEQGDATLWRTKNVGGGVKAGDHVGRTKLGVIRHGSAYGFIIGLVLLGVWFSSVFAPNILLVNIKEMFTNDLADATIALYTYDQKMLDFKLGKADCGQKDSIKCKLTTMSRNEVKRFERAGFKVDGQKIEEDNLDDNDYTNDKPESRYKVSSITFPHGAGSASSAQQYDQNANKSNNIKALTYSVFNPKSSFYMDERFKQRLKWRYDLTKTPTITGDTEEDVDKSFDASMEGSDEKMDDTGAGNYSLKGLGGRVGQEGLKNTSKRIAGLANSYVGIQCAYYTQFKVAYNAMKNAKTVSVARFAMQYLKTADQIKSGLVQEAPANVLSSKMAWSDDGSYFGANATDGSMYQHILFNQPAKNESLWQYTLDTYDSFGILLPAWMLTVFITQQAVQGVAHITDGSLGAPGTDLAPPTGPSQARKYCLEGQKDSNKIANKPNDCPTLTTVGTPAPLIPAVAPYAAMSARTCPYPIWMMYPTTKLTVETVMPFIAETVNTAVSAYVSSNVKNFTAQTKGKQAAEALFAGTGEVLGDMAMSRGMRPGTVASMSEYLAEGEKIQKELDEIARFEAQQQPFNIANKYSFMGTFIRSLSFSDTDSATPASALSNAFSLVPTAMSHVVAGDSAKAFYHIQPRTFDQSRLQCQDQEYKQIGIQADVLCNIRYSMSKADLQAEPKQVLDYMLQAHPNETQKNVQELQQRLVVTDNGNDLQDKADVQRQLNQAMEGSNAKMIDEKTGKPTRFSEYEKYMNYCVNRQDPWGRTAMAVRREGLSDEEKAERFKDKYGNGEPIDKSNNSGDPYEMKVAEGGKSAYMAVSEGADADQNWYTGKKCLEESEMLKNFRAYTMMCMVDGSHSGAADCTEKDRWNYYFDGFYNVNDVIYVSWW